MATVLEHKVFSKTELKSNSNKYWRVWYYDDGSIETQNGRQGVKDGQRRFITATGRGAYEAKIREKLRKNYVENEVVDGSGSIAVSSKQVAHSELKDIASKQIKSKNPIVATLIDFLVGVNAHSILQASNGSIQYDTSTASFKTTQGIVIPSQVDRARLLLSGLYDNVKDGIYTGRGFLDSVDEYLSLIPRDFGRHKMTPQDIFPNLTAIQKENDILDSLDSSFAGLQTTKPSKTKKKTTQKVFDVDMEIIDDKKVISRINSFYSKNKRSMHSSSRYRLKTIYQVNINTVVDAFEKKGKILGNVKELFHGSKCSNLLSILRQGLIIPPSSSAHVTGRLGGNGCYGSDISSKALNYSTNFWGGGGSTNRVFMFLCDFAMGKMYRSKGYGDYKTLKDGYNSTFMEGGKYGLLNNEMIVYECSQVNLKYLLEFE